MNKKITINQAVIAKKLGVPFKELKNKLYKVFVNKQDMKYLKSLGKK